jgi:hypothetical protein
MYRSGKRAVMLVVGLTVLLGSVGPPTPVTAAQAATPVTECPVATSAENLEVVRSFFEEGMNGADLSVFDQIAAPDIVYYGATVGDDNGLEAVKRIYGDALTGFLTFSTPFSPRSRMAMPSHSATVSRAYTAGISGDWRRPVTRSPGITLHLRTLHAGESPRCGPRSISSTGFRNSESSPRKDPQLAWPVRRHVPRRPR